MRQFLARRRPSPALAVAFIALLAALSGTAVALPGRNTVDSGDLKRNSVRSSDIRAGAVKTSELGANAVTSAKVRNNTVTGNDVDESTFGKVPSATSADTAANATNANRAATAGGVDGRIPFFLKLEPGQTQLIAENGAVSIFAQCLTEGGNDIIRLLANTTQDGAVMEGAVDHPGTAGNFLNIATPEAQRILLLNQAADGTTSVANLIDNGFVMAPDGQSLGVDSESTALGVNYAGAGCITTGVVNAVG
jgi:hypothetical protein